LKIGSGLLFGQPCISCLISLPYTLNFPAGLLVQNNNSNMSKYARSGKARQTICDSKTQRLYSMAQKRKPLPNCK